MPAVALRSVEKNRIYSHSGDLLLSPAVAFAATVMCERAAVAVTAALAYANVN